MDKEVISDLRTDVLSSVESSYAEYNTPESEFLIENIKGVFRSAEVYEFPDLEEQLIKSVEFLFAEGDNPRESVVKKNIEAVFLSWRYDNQK